MDTQSQHKETAPAYGAKAFRCPICSAYANMRWLNPFGVGAIYRPFMISRCDGCDQELLWRIEVRETEEGDQQFGRIIYPPASTAPMHHIDLPEDLQQEYNEARAIVEQSPRGAAALLRLCLEKLCAHLTGNDGKSINDNIKDLVAKDLPIRVQQSLDYLRVVGNNAVHPGQIDLRDTPEMVLAMFGLINFIVDNQITQPKTIETLYSHIPEGAREAVERRDATK